MKKLHQVWRAVKVLKAAPGLWRHIITSLRAVQAMTTSEPGGCRSCVTCMPPCRSLHPPHKPPNSPAAVTMSNLGGCHHCECTASNLLRCCPHWSAQYCMKAQQLVMSTAGLAWQAQHQVSMHHARCFELYLSLSHTEGSWHITNFYSDLCVQCTAISIHKAA